MGICWLNTLIVRGLPFFAWLAEWMDRRMKKLREGIAVIVRKILWPSHQC